MPTSSETAVAAGALARDLGGLTTMRAPDGDVIDGIRPGFVVTPEEPDQVAPLLGAVGRHKATAVARGRGTKLDWGAPPERADVLVDLGALDAVVDHAAGDLVVRVQPAVPLARLAEVLAPAGQRFGVDEVIPGSTVGGVIATGLGGPTRMIHGSVRDLLLGVTVALADGRRATSGGRVVKNVAGYDLGKLYTGSFGTLGIVTEAVLRLHPLPERQAWISVAIGAEDRLATLAAAVLAGPVAPAAMELHRPPSGGIDLAVLLEGTERGVDGRARSTAEVLGPDATVRPEAPTWWGRLPGSGEGATMIKLTMELAAVPAVSAALRPHPVELAGSAGTGVLWAGIDAGTDSDAVAAALDAARRACRAGGGSAVVLRAPAEVRARVDTWGPVPAIGLMRRVKAGFDPGRVLAPGRFVGGI